MFRLKGIIPPMITPFDVNGNVDYAGLKTLVDFLKTRVDGLFITGSYGSGPMMSIEERKKVAAETVKACQGDIPVIVMVGTTNNRDSVELTRHAEQIGAQAVASVGPYYFAHNDDSVRYFFDDMMKCVARDFPVYVYNNPKFQGYPMSLGLLKSLKEMGLRGIKDASFDILLHANYQRVLKSADFEIALGTEAMWLPAVSLGCEAFIPGLGNAFPEICRKMYLEGISGDMAACRKTQFEVNEMRDIMYLARSTQLAIYAMLEVRGILKAYPRAPFIPASESEKLKIRNALNDLHVL